MLKMKDNVMSFKEINNTQKQMIRNSFIRIGVSDVEFDEYS